VWLFLLQRGFKLEICWIEVMGSDQ
jgi:hypothetical protein